MRMNTNNDTTGPITRRPDARILDDMENIVTASENRGLNDDFLGENCPVRDQIDSISQKFGITARQAIIFSVMVNMNSRYKVNDTDLAGFFNCSLINILDVSDDIMALTFKKLLIKYSGDGSDSYRVPQRVIGYLKKNEAFKARSYKCSSEEELAQELDKVFDGVEYRNHCPEVAKVDIDGFIEANKEMPLCKAVFDLKLKDEMLETWAFRLVTSTIEGGDGVSLGVINRIYEEEIGLDFFRKSFRDENNSLFKSGFIECVGDAFMGYSYCLTRKGIDTLIPQFKAALHKGDNEGRGIINHEKITPKMMFYNKGEGDKVEELIEILQPQNFSNVTSRLQEKGMRKGFTCILYGGPGTGKTETVLQIARRTGRNIMQVDMSQIRDKWVGESEKHVKDIFDGYKSLLAKSDKEPILLFNEADALLGKRLATERSVDKMENAMQNIILQEMETFEGILIATTNLTCNLDAAFERRFLFKIELSSPSVEAREHIWASMLPFLDEATAGRLAEEFCFSGGQMENIARKCSVNSILHGDDVINYDVVRGYCLAESINEGTSVQPRKKIGFVI